MTRAEACLKLVQALPASLTESLVRQLAAGVVPSIPNPGYQARLDEFMRQWPGDSRELAAMMEMALACIRSAPGIEMVWTGPSVGAVPGRRTEQVLLELIQSAQQQLTVMRYGVFQVERVVSELESALHRGVRVRIVLGDRNTPHDQDINY